MQNRETAQQIAYRHAKYAQEQGILYTEIIVNPSHWKNIRTGELLTGVLEGFDQAGADGLPDCRLLVSLRREQDTASARRTIEWILSHRHPRLVGVSVDGNEACSQDSNQRFAPLLARAAEAGLGIAVHAGESSGPEGVQEALELLGAKRIDHGVRAVEDLKLLERLLRERISLNICYTSNVAGGLYTPGNHPLGELYSRGISVTVNTDDPQLLRVSLSQELQRVAEQYHWKIEELLKLQYYAVDAAFCTEERRSELLSRLHQFEATCQNLTAF
ncbi:MAG: adenosine deaminase family protein [Dysosmobacter welbionis]